MDVPSSGGHTCFEGNADGVSMRQQVRVDRLLHAQLALTGAGQINHVVTQLAALATANKSMVTSPKYTRPYIAT